MFDPERTWFYFRGGKEDVKPEILKKCILTYTIFLVKLYYEICKNGKNLSKGDSWEDGVLFWDG